ncbi:uncharacterized protein LOC123269106 [Cotesia glomerata]|uniref:Uncharacterized protein n=1 Tax=Cotesia glomerata TaxID=32391 RepID=A0AAV7IRG0_COTGL|nr:uncharacterized protein LOC123269106 [Cotesia glomerata]KAH0567348.1 hypothetical protein KQX54_008620 [Cotesia glomerata]
MILFTAFLLVTVSSQFIHAEDAPHRRLRAPQQSRADYQAPDGYEKIFTPNSQRKAREQGQNTRQEPIRAPVQKQTEFYQYKPYSAIPENIKQLLNYYYTPQAPYVNPHSFFYNINPMQTLAQDNSEDNSKQQEYLPPQESKQFSASEQFPGPESWSPSTRQPTYSPPAGYDQNQQNSQAHRSNYPSHTLASIKKTPKAGIKYKDDLTPNQYQNQNQNDQRFGYRSSANSRQDQGKRSLEKDLGNFEQKPSQGYSNMPQEISQILQFQAQIPYNVLANQILFEFKKPFVPQPLPNDIQYSGHYPNKVYYVRPDGEIVDHPPEEASSGQNYKY